MKWISFEPKSSELFLDAKLEQIVIEGNTGEKTSLLFELNGTYERIGDYLEYLEKTGVSLVVVQDLFITKKEPSQVELNLRCLVDIYLLRGQRPDFSEKNQGAVPGKKV